MAPGTAGKAAKQLQASEERLRLAMAVGSLSVFELDHRTETVSWSSTDSVALPEDRTASADLTEAFGLVHPHDRDRLVSGLERARERGGDGQFEGEYRVVRPNGDLRWMSVSAHAFLGPDGRPERTIGVVADITERYEAAARLRESEQRYRSLVDELDAVVLEVEVATGALYVSQQARAVFGYSAEQLAAPGFWRSLVIPEDRERVFAYWDHDAELDGYDLEYRMRRADGQVIWLDTRMRSFKGPDGRAARWFGLAVDISARKRLEETVARSDRLEAMSRIAAAAAHDFGNVLLGIRIYQAYLAASIPADDPRHADIEQIGSAVDRGAALTTQLLDFGRDRAPDRPGPVDLAATLGDLEPVLARVAGSSVRLTIDAGAEARARISRGHLEQALLNLVINARDAMPDGGDLLISVREERVDNGSGLGIVPGPYVVLAVQDTGTGMTPEVLERALEPFFTTKKNGTGVGLSSVYGTVREAGGTVRIESGPGRGTSIQMLLPKPPGLRHRHDRPDAIPV